MAGELNKYNHTTKILNNISPSFCLAKWLQVTLHLQNGRNHSCHHPSTHSIPIEELENDPSALHNTAYKKTLRKQMLEGVRLKECQYCWNVEDLPGEHISDRTIKSSDPWAAPHLQRIANGDSKTNINPTYVEVSFSNVCNFKCSYCSPVHSSQWVHEVEKHGPYELTGRQHNNLDWYKQNKEMPIHHNDYNPYVEAFWKWWPDLVKGLKVFRITGGEPLLDKNTFKVLDFLYDNPQPQLELYINTNACVPDDLVDKYIEKQKALINENKIKKVKLYTSVDGHGKQAEYGRHGLNYNKWYANIDKIMTEIPRLEVTIMCTTNILSITSFDKLLQDILTLKLKHKIFNVRNTPLVLDMSILNWPGHQCASILPEGYSDLLLSSLKYMQDNLFNTIPNHPWNGFYDFEIAKMERFIEFIKQKNESYTPTMLRDFYLFVNEHDKRRDTNFLETFPELESFYRICEQENNNRII